MLDFFSKVKQIRASGNDQGEILLNSQPPFFLKVLNAHDNNISKSLISKLEKKNLSSYEHHLGYFNLPTLNHFPPYFFLFFIFAHLIWILYSQLTTTGNMSKKFVNKNSCGLCSES